MLKPVVDALEEPYDALVVMVPLGPLLEPVVDALPGPTSGPEDVAFVVVTVEIMVVVMYVF